MPEEEWIIFLRRVGKSSFNFSVCKIPSRDV